jgi:ribosomal protein S18 acetylase RimI-like enzyme
MRVPDYETSSTLDRPIPSQVPPHFRSRPITKADFDAIVQVVDHWWEGPIGALVHPMFFYEFGKYARVVEDTAREGRFVGFLLGMVIAGDESTPSSGYIHLVGIDPEYRRRGVARALYADFIDTCRALGCKRLKAITTVGNQGSLRFHESMSFTAHEDPDYAGPGRKRLVFVREL